MIIRSPEKLVLFPGDVSAVHNKSFVLVFNFVSHAIVLFLQFSIF